MNSCEKVAIICNKAQYHEATLLEKLQLKFHVLMCKRCSKYTKKNTKLSSLCDKANLRALSKADKMNMKESLKKTT